MNFTFEASTPAARIGLGLAALGRPAYINLGHAGDLAGHTDEQSLEGRAHAVLDRAYADGVRYFDAARSYGKAEAFLGSWLARRENDPADVTVGSKWGYTYTANWQIQADTHEIKELTLANLRRQLPESRALLGEHLRLYQIHSATLDSGVLADAALLEELARLRAEGLGIGLTVSGVAQPETIERALEVGGFDAVQATWNLLERSAGRALEAAHTAGLTVIVKEAVANGRLAGRDGVPALERAARGLALAPDALALAAVLAQPWSDIVLSGASTTEMLVSNLAAAGIEAEVGLEVAEALSELVEEPERYWRERSELAWN